MSYQIIILVGEGVDSPTFNRYAGPHRIATELRNEGYTVKVLYGLNYYNSEILIDMLEKIVDANTICIGFSTTFLFRFFITKMNNFKKVDEGIKIDTPNNLYDDNIRKISLHFKQKFKKLKIVLGGSGSRFKVSHPHYVDAFFEGYSDLSFKKYINDINNNVKFLGQQHIVDKYGTGFNFRDSRIDYEHDDMIFPNECVTIEVSRGCRFKCKFCTYPLLGRNAKDDSWIKKSDNIYKELMTNYERFGTTNYVFSDDTYNDSLDKIKYLHRIFTSLPFKINFATYLRLDLLYRYPEMIHILKESGLVGAFFGMETFNPYAKRIIGKGMANEKLLGTLETANKVWKDDVNITYTFIYGLPGETVETMRDWTDNIILKNRLFDKHLVVIRPLHLMNIPNSLYTSEFERNYEKYNYKIGESQMDWTSDTTNYFECAELADEAMYQLNKSSRHCGAFATPVLLGYGYTKDEIYNLNYNDKHVINKIEYLTHERYDNYKQWFYKIHGS